MGHPVKRRLRNKTFDITKKPARPEDDSPSVRAEKDKAIAKFAKTKGVLRLEKQAGEYVQKRVRQ